MATSLLKQLLNLTGIKLPDLNGNYDPSVYRDESGTATQNQSATQAGTTGQSSNLTGVAKYLAKKQPQDNSPAQTGVAKYLAKKQPPAPKQSAQASGLTGVARYLASQSTRDKPRPAPVKTATASPDKLTGVDKYLSRQKTTTAEKPKSAKVESQTAKEKPATRAAVAAEKKPVSAPTPKAQAEQPKAKPATKAPTAAAKVIDLTEKASQCQASTLKGTQCRRKTNLENIDKIVNDKHYKFAVCSQHNNTDFVPFSEYVQ